MIAIEDLQSSTQGGGEHDIISRALTSHGHIRIKLSGNGGAQLVLLTQVLVASAHI